MLISPTLLYKTISRAHQTFNGKMGLLPTCQAVF
jgi:hypothetical protein